MTLKREGIVAAVQRVIGQYTGMRLTLRQIYYRLVAAQVFPNTLSSYKFLSTVLVEARKAGTINYDSIEDRTRAIHDGHGQDRTAAQHFNMFWDYVVDMDNRYTMPKWWGQPKRVQVWLEKQALSALFEQITDAEGVDLMVCRGYPSLTFLWEAANRLRDVDDGQQVVIVYFGDFDPSGEDIERYAMETLRDEFGIDVDFRRVAINQEQIAEYNIPPAPAKTTDARYDAFVAEHGVAWQVELDAIEPRTLQGLVQAAVRGEFNRRQGQVRDQELQRRRDQIKDWLDEAVNPDFEQPTDGGA